MKSLKRDALSASSLNPGMGNQENVLFVLYSVPQDRSSHNNYAQDKLYRTFISNNNLCPLDWHVPHRPWTYRSTIAKLEQDANYTLSRIGDILLPSRLIQARNRLPIPNLLLYC
eukprot:1160654-Pelagomonas_calceolata.AAC.5